MLVKPTLKLRLSMQYLNGQQCIVFHEVLFIEEKIAKSSVHQGEILQWKGVFLIL